MFRYFKMVAFFGSVEDKEVENVHPMLHDILSFPKLLVDLAIHNSYNNESNHKNGHTSAFLKFFGCASSVKWQRSHWLDEIFNSSPNSIRNHEPLTSLHNFTSKTSAKLNLE